MKKREKIMTKISMEVIKVLREQTGVGLTKCKEALEASNGDLDQAILYLRKMGLASASKKESRETKEGTISIKSDDQGIALIEVNVETDFVANNEKFRSFVETLCKELLVCKVTDVSQFLNTTYSQDVSLTIDQLKALSMQSLGENIQVKRLLYIKKEDSSSYGIYSHGGGKVVSLVTISGSAKEEGLAKDFAMHVAASSPLYISEEMVPESIIQQEREVALNQVKGKPEAVIEKIVSGKLTAFFAENCLLDQQFIKDPSKRIKEILEEESKATESNLSITSFLRWKVGE